MSIVGGALAPPLMGHIADISSMRVGFAVPLSALFSSPSTARCGRSWRIRISRAAAPSTSAGECWHLRVARPHRTANPARPIAHPLRLVYPERRSGQCNRKDPPRARRGRARHSVRAAPATSGCKFSPASPSRPAAEQGLPLRSPCRPFSATEEFCLTPLGRTDVLI